ncbi:putative membrane protein YlbC [Paraliobacillus quinghaiensis]|uniref:Membrane protein YlbC n=1 Tax=Paraliobacillus quinghaiensis TaxID=470815 RepID=A0A917TEP9_9BACI|nr:CAP domain-containing protein [Paraliobacillus quinghaiensis]GGM20424.1 putative membrane protein YlbC [Paraliobacillus quinghaiensis]
MNMLKNILFLFLMIFGLIYIIQGESGTDKIVSNIELWLIQNESAKDLKLSSQNPVEKKGHEKNFLDWIDRTTGSLQEEYGEPIRKDLSGYGYTWWIYQNEVDYYIQFGIKEDKIVTVFATGDAYNFDPIQLGASYRELQDHYQFEDNVSFSTYTFKLTDLDKEIKPLKQLSENLFIQFYFDSHTDRLSSFRLMTKDILLVQQPYELYYRGELPEPPIISTKQWRIVETGAEKQIFDITNVIRKRFNQKQLTWNQQAREVAYKHSKDMAVNNYFSHYSQTGDGLKERLESNHTYYKAAGENIAAQHIDGPAAVEGWLNSKGHRQALIKADYTDLGVGVYQDYYTQNFLKQ